MEQLHKCVSVLGQLERAERTPNARSPHVGECVSGANAQDMDVISTRTAARIWCYEDYKFEWLEALPTKFDLNDVLV